MRDTILTAIRDTISHHPADPLGALTGYDAETLAEAITHALTDTYGDALPDDSSPRPLAFTADQVLTMLAEASQASATATDHDPGDRRGPGLPVTRRTWSPTHDDHHFKHLVLGVQHLFGVRVRTHLGDNGRRTYTVAGTAPRIAAFTSALDTLRDAAAPATPTDGRAAAFWTLLAEVVTETPEALLLTADLAEETRHAQQHLVNTLGSARTLPRAATDGHADLREAVHALAAATSPAVPRTR